jgi:hypothetical protein
LFELALLYATVADMALKPTGADAAFLGSVSAILAGLAANVLLRLQAAPAGNTEG